MTIIAVIFVQAVLGVYHHRNYLKLQRKSWFTYLHIWLGRVVIVSGLANAGCGLNLAGVQWKYVAIWWAGTGFLAIVYAVLGVMRWRKIIGGEIVGVKGAGSGVSSAERIKNAGNYEMS